MLIAALASVVISSCYDGDTCRTNTGECIRLACRWHTTGSRQGSNRRIDVRVVDPLLTQDESDRLDG